jgi:hypothetical protein
MRGPVLPSPAGADIARVTGQQRFGAPYYRIGAAVPGRDDGGQVTVQSLHRDFGGACVANREQFRLGVEIRFEQDNPAVDAILMVIEDGFGREAVSRSAADENGVARATIRFESPSVDARRVNWLHRQLGTLAKYLLGPTDVECEDAEGREASYRLDPTAPVPAHNGDTDAGEADPEAVDASCAEADAEEAEGGEVVETESDDRDHG